MRLHARVYAGGNTPSKVSYFLLKVNVESCRGLIERCKVVVELQ